MRRIITIYHCLSSNNRFAFWNVTCSFILAIITAWMGFAVSYIIMDGNKRMQTQMLRYQNYQFFHENVDAFLLKNFHLRKQISYIKKDFNNIIESCPKDAHGKFIFRQQDYDIINKCVNELVVELRKTNIEEMREHLYVLSQCVEPKETSSICANYFNVILAKYILTDEHILKEALIDNLSTDPLFVRYAYSIPNELIDKAWELRMLIQNPDSNTIYSAKLGELKLALDYIYTPLAQIEVIIRNNYLPSIEGYPIVAKMALTLFAILLIGGGLWYALLVTIFKEKINVNSSDDYNKLLREKAEIEEKYKIKCSEIITYDNNKHISDEKLEKLENKNDVIEKRYIWMLEQLKDLVLSNDISLDEKEKVVRIMNDSKHIN